MSSLNKGIKFKKSTLASKVNINIDLSNERISMHLTRTNCKKPLKYPCNFCGRKFTTDCQRRRHEKSHIEQPYSCKICAKRFDFKVMLVHHLRNGCNKIETKDRATNDISGNATKHFQCKVCRKIFPSNETYENHFIDIHIKNRLKCHECSYIFQHRDDLHEHTDNSNYENKMYPCSICVKEFTNIKCLNCHKEIAHHIRYKKTYKKGMHGGKIKILNTDVNRRFNKNDKSFYDFTRDEDRLELDCNSMNFETMYSDSDDSVLSSDMDQKPSLNSLETLRSHDFNLNHATSEENCNIKKEFSCGSNSLNTSESSLPPLSEMMENKSSEFDTTISKRASLRKNLKNISYEESLVDDIVFDSENELKVSALKRIGTQKHLKFNYRCNKWKKWNNKVNVSSTGLPMCYVKLEKMSDKKIAALMGSNTKKISYTNKSIDTPNEILKKIGIEPRAAIGLECNLCNTVFRSSKLKIQHMRLHHKSLVYKCKDCDKSFNNRCNLSRHYIGQHAGINFFKCQYCERSFNYKDSLNRHVKFHFQEKRYPCKFCGERFIDWYELRIHKKSQHASV